MIRYPRTPGSGRAVATFAAGRQCAATGCVTVLSIYNPDLRCGAHAGKWMLDGPGAAERRGHNKGGRPA